MLNQISISIDMRGGNIRIAYQVELPQPVISGNALSSDRKGKCCYCKLDEPKKYKYNRYSALAKKLEDLGCVAIMPLAAPIGSGLGVQNPVNLRLIIENSALPVLVDAGVGTASDAAIAMELGCDGVLMNTAIAEAKDPIAMARAMRLAIEAGRLAYLAGRMAKKQYADPSSPLAGLI